MEGSQADYYKLQAQGCENWADKEMCQLKKKLEALEKKENLGVSIFLTSPNVQGAALLTIYIKLTI